MSKIFTHHQSAKFKSWIPLLYSRSYDVGTPVACMSGVAVWIHAEGFQGTINHGLEVFLSVRIVVVSLEHGNRG